MSLFQELNEIIPKQLSGKKYADNKVGFLLGVNYFAKSSIKGSGIIGSLIYDSHLHNIFSLTGEFAPSIVDLDGLYWGDFTNL